MLPLYDNITHSFCFGKAIQQIFNFFRATWNDFGEIEWQCLPLAGRVGGNLNNDDTLIGLTTPGDHLVSRLFFCRYGTFA